MKKRSAFTLVELLIVIAIIGILASLLLPAVGRVQINAKSGSTRTLLSQIESALNQYKAVYGFYPDFLEGKGRINLAEGTNTENLVKSLSAKNPDGTNLSNSDRVGLNRQNKSFLNFDQKSLIRSKNGAWRIVDAFNNPNIYIVVSTSGVIKEGYPTVKDGIPADEFKELVPDIGLGIRKNVILFTLKKDAFDNAKIERESFDFEAQNIFSW